MPKRTEPTYEAILKALPDLTAEQRAQIRLRISALPGGKEDPKSMNTANNAQEEDEKFLLFYDVFVGVLKDKMGGKYPPSRIGFPKAQQKELREGWECVEGLLLTAFEKAGRKARHPERIKFYEVVVVLTVEYVELLAEEIGVPLARKTIIQQLNNCATTLNNQFPGYVRSGLLPLALKWSKSTNTPDEEDL